MKNLIKILLLTGVLLALGACKEDKIAVFEGENNIYFRQKYWQGETSSYTSSLVYDGKTFSIRTDGGINKVIDSIEVSLAFLREEQRVDTMFIPVRVMGDIAPVERKINFKIVQTDEPDAAKENVNYRVLDAFIPANRRDGGIVVELSRDGLEDLVDGRHKTIDFELLANENFSVNYPLIKYSSAKDSLASTLHMRVIFTDGLATPPEWNPGGLVEGYLGRWSTRKAYVLIYELGMSWEFLYNPAKGISVLGAYGSVLKRWLADYKKEHGVPYYEADGVTEMTAGIYV